MVVCLLGKSWSRPSSESVCPSSIKGYHTFPVVYSTDVRALSLAAGYPLRHFVVRPHPCGRVDLIQRDDVERWLLGCAVCPPQPAQAAARLQPLHHFVPAHKSQMPGQTDASGIWNEAFRRRRKADEHRVEAAHPQLPNTAAFRRCCDTTHAVQPRLGPQPLQPRVVLRRGRHNERTPACGYRWTRSGHHFSSACAGYRTKPGDFEVVRARGCLGATDTKSTIRAHAPRTYPRRRP